MAHGVCTHGLFTHEKVSYTPFLLKYIEGSLIWSKSLYLVHQASSQTSMTLKVSGKQRQHILQMVEIDFSDNCKHEKNAF